MGQGLAIVFVLVKTEKLIIMNNLNAYPVSILIEMNIVLQAGVVIMGQALTSRV